jgi:hypothetical protein
MSSKLRRFELLLPVRFNDGRDIPEEWLGSARRNCRTLRRRQFERQNVEGCWRHKGTLYRDDLSRIIVDVPDKRENRDWMKSFKRRWKIKLEQIDFD